MRQHLEGFAAEQNCGYPALSMRGHMTCVFFLASVFKVRTCVGVHARRFEFLVIK